ncbi:MAG: SIS domain-containing protein [Nitrosarchaeum sp.]|nr:SIS domain-containing protein [Nitrosarchaeum sp.]MCA9819700.1 SIS domain-containing protein [Nitrosarchaeum sp.]
MYQFYDNWPAYAREAFGRYSDPSLAVNGKYFEVDHIVFAGMGGSGAIGDLFAAILSRTNIHISVVKGYLLPRTVDSNTLVIITSVSGNTAEAMTNISSAKDAGCKILAFSSGGKIEKFCNQQKVEFNKIEKLHSPRVSFVRYVYSILGILQGILPIQREDILESIKKMEKLSESISSKNMTEENPAVNLAKWITGIPMIYYPWGLQAAAIRFKNSLQENAKRHAMAEDVIEACHNGIVAWEKQNSNIMPILIQGADDYTKTKDQWKILKTYFGQNNIEYKEVHTIQGSILSKIMHLIYLLDYTTIYNSVISGVDPSPTASIEYVKKSLAQGIF